MSEPTSNSEAGRPWSLKRTFCVGIAGLALGVGVIFSLSFVRGCREHMKYDCRLQLRHLGLRCREHAASHEGQLPGKWSELTWDDLGGIENTTWIYQFRCPSRGQKAGAWASVDLWADYRLIPGRTTNDPPTTVLAIEPLSNHKKGVNVLFVDGSATWWSAEKLVVQDPVGPANR